MTQPPESPQQLDDAENWPPGNCSDCHHRWADHDERDGCGACAFQFTCSCKRWPEPVEMLAQRLHDAACSCGDQYAGVSSYWLKIARAATAELAP